MSRQRSGTWFAIVPVGTKSPASFPSSAATRSWSAFTVGSSPNWSSPQRRGRHRGAHRGVGTVTVSERRSIIAAAYAAATERDRLDGAPVVLGGDADVRLLAHRARRDADRLHRRRGIEHRHDEQRLDLDGPRPARMVALHRLADDLREREHAPPDRRVEHEPVAGRDPRAAREAGAAQQFGAGLDPVLGERSAGVADRLEPVALHGGSFPPMETRRLGGANLELSAIGLGSWLTYAGGVGRERTEACTRAAFEAGITFFDTANVHGKARRSGRGGNPLGLPARLLRAGDEALLPDRATHDRGLSREQVLKQIDASLERLRTDHVDLYQCHRYDDGRRWRRRWAR